MPMLPLLISCSGSPSRVIQLPPGVTELTKPIEIAPGSAGVTVRGDNSTLRLAAGFQGKAAIVIRAASRIVLEGFVIDGNRDRQDLRLDMPPPETPFADHFPANGVLADSVEKLTIRNVRFQNVASFPVLITRSRRIEIERVAIERSGSRNAKGRNNTTGGILFEEGVAGFAVRDSTFLDVLGNGVWTHSRATSPRNSTGVISGNRFARIGRDAIQAGHATRVRVTANEGSLIGFPPDAVDIENLAVPVAIDTAGNVDQSVYTDNRFTEINGKCIDLDGFHHGRVSGNTCRNTRSDAEYPHGHYGIVFNNTNTEMRSEAVVVEDNTIDGARYGGLFLIGAGHIVRRNRFLNVNRARCGSVPAPSACRYKPEEPDLLRAGIYLGSGAERPDPARDNRIEHNVVTGFGAAGRCIAAAPGVSLEANRTAFNKCGE